MNQSTQSTLQMIQCVNDIMHRSANLLFYLLAGELKTSNSLLIVATTYIFLL